MSWTLLNETFDSTPPGSESLDSSAFLSHAHTEVKIPHLEQNNLFQGSTFGSCMQNTWTPNGCNMKMPETTAPNQNSSSTEPFEEKACKIGNDFWGEFDNQALQSCQQAYFSTPFGGLPTEATHGGSSLDTSTSPHHRHGLDFKCGWEGCTSATAYARDTSLWRHIKEKHIYPGRFKCTFLRCGKSFGRKDKLQEHLRSAHAETEGRKRESCRSCQA
ncbi:unnamed protein product [Penicillium bialowiezense]